MSLRHQLLWAHLHIEGRDFSISLVSERSLLGHGDRPHFPAPFPLPSQSPLVSPALTTAAVTGASSGTFPPGAAQESRPLVPNDHVLLPHPRPPSPPFLRGPATVDLVGTKFRHPKITGYTLRNSNILPPRAPKSPSSPVERAWTLPRTQGSVPTPMSPVCVPPSLPCTLKCHLQTGDVSVTPVLLLL